MIRTFISFIILIASITILIAQIPQGINYQTVVRNSANNIIPNQTVNFRFSIISGSSTGSIVYSEIHSATTNQLGLVNLIIGRGTPLTGTFSGINWASAAHFLSVEIDPSGGTNFQAMGTQQLMSVPYALSAGSTSTFMAQLTDVSVAAVVDGQVLKWNAAQSKWLPANDISGGGAGDNWGTQVVQTNGTLTGNGTPANPLAVNGILTDNQTLNINGNTLSISGGNSVSLPSGGSGSSWNLAGNTSTNPNADFVGTVDNQPIIIRTNNIERARITTKGQIELLNTGQSVFLGNSAGANDDLTNNRNIFIGDSTGFSNSNGSNNTAIGHRAFLSNTSGFQNCAIGSSALSSNTTGGGNVALGSMALSNNTSGGSNVAVGQLALVSNSTGTRNIAIGNALNSNTVGSDNTAVGDGALVPSIGNENTAIGAIALNSNTTGNGNTALGFWAGYSGTEITTGSYNTLIGYYASADNSSRTNSIVIAGNDNLSLGGNNRVRIGNSSMTSIGGQVAWTNLSDERVKQNVSENVVGLPFILKLKPVTYQYSVNASESLQRKESSSDWTGKFDIENIRFSGFMAQDVEAAAQSVGYSFSGVDKPEDADGLWGLRYSEFVVPLVKAVQEQQVLIEQLLLEIENLKSKIE